MSTPDWVADAVATLPALVTTEEAAGTLRISRRTLARYQASGRLRGVRTDECGSGKVLFPRREIERFLCSLRTPH